MLTDYLVRAAEAAATPELYGDSARPTSVLKRVPQAVVATLVVKERPAPFDIPGVTSDSLYPYRRYEVSA